MSLKQLFSCLLIVATLGACSNSTSSETTAPIDSTGTDEVDERPALPAVALLPGVMNYLEKEDSSFQPTLFEESGSGSMSSVQGRAIDTARLAPFRPFLLFNSDSSFALDLVSYNYVPVQRNGATRLEEGGPDFEVAMINFRKGQSKRLLFFGSSGASVFEGAWKDGSVWIAGATDWNNSDSLRPILWRYDPVADELQTYTYPVKIAADWSKYPTITARVKR